MDEKVLLVDEDVTAGVVHHVVVAVDHNARPRLPPSQVLGLDSGRHCNLSALHNLLALDLYFQISIVYFFSRPAL